MIRPSCDGRHPARDSSGSRNAARADLRNGLGPRVADGRIEARLSGVRCAKSLRQAEPRADKSHNHQIAKSPNLPWHPVELLPIFSRTPRTKYSIQLLSFIASCAGVSHPAQNKRTKKTIHCVIYGSESDVSHAQGGSAASLPLLSRTPREPGQNAELTPRFCRTLPQKALSGSGTIGGIRK